MSRVLSGQFIYTPVVVLDDAFFGQLEHQTKLQFSAERRMEVEQALKAYVAGHYLHAAASRPKSVNPMLEQMCQLSTRLAKLIESRTTNPSINAAVLLVEQADDEADDNWRTIGDTTIRNTLEAAYRQRSGKPPPVSTRQRAERGALDWITIAYILRRIERAARYNLENRSQDAGGPSGDPYLYGLIRNLHHTFVAAGGLNRTSTFDPYVGKSGKYKGPFLNFVKTCLAKLEELHAPLPGATLPLPRYTPMALGKAIQRAMVGRRRT